jgi:predicted trehalose synthase
MRASTPLPVSCDLRAPSAWRPSRWAPDAQIRRSQTEQSNSSVIVGQQIIIKLFRRIHAGPHPEAEMGLYLSEARLRQYRAAAG